MLLTDPGTKDVPCLVPTSVVVSALRAIFAVLASASAGSWKREGRNCRNSAVSQAQRAAAQRYLEKSIQKKGVPE